jgi:hypothetical protein
MPYIGSNTLFLLDFFPNGETEFIKVFKEDSEGFSEP